MKSDIIINYCSGNKVSLCIVFGRSRSSLIRLGFVELLNYFLPVVTSVWSDILVLVTSFGKILFSGTVSSYPGCDYMHMGWLRYNDSDVQ